MKQLEFLDEFFSKNKTGLFIGGILGVAISHIISPAFSSKTVETKTVQRTEQKTQAVEVSQVQKDSTTGQQTSYVEKSFNNKGILIHEVISGQKIDTSTQLAQNDVKKTESATVSTLSQESKTTIENRPNWEMGFLTSYPFQMQKITPLIGYRLFGGVHLIGSTDLKFSQFQAGILLEL